MTERLADISLRIENIGQLGTVVNAMRGIAGARAQAARAQLAAVEDYTAIIAAAIGRGFSLLEETPRRVTSARHPAQVLFCAEQGFAGGFSDHVLTQAAPGAKLFLLGTRGGGLAAERGLLPAWSAALPAASSGVPDLAGQIAGALYNAITGEGIDQVDLLYCQWQPPAGLRCVCRHLLPLDPGDFSSVALRGEPFLNLPPAALLEALTMDYVHAVLCEAAMHSFVAENEARIVTMAAAHRHVDAQLQSLEQTRRIVRQEEITAEIIELAASAGARASRNVRDEA
jgi:F-type H+-transporting ATPase subunit gamma